MSSIEIRNLHMSYDKNKPVLSGVNFTAEKGQIIGYIGPNGAGKSTTVKIILGLVDDYQGEVLIDGIDVKESEVYKNKIGYMPENGEMYEALTPTEYLNLIGKLYDMEDDVIEAKISSLMEIFEIKAYRHQRIHSFSKGMKQKVLFISSIFHNPDIIILDEPLSGLDANSVMIIKEILLQLAREGKTIFYSSHIMDVVEKISDRIILLKDGIVVADGTFKDLKENEDESLEHLFNDLTGFNNHENLAKKFIDIIGDNEVVDDNEVIDDNKVIGENHEK